MPRKLKKRKQAAVELHFFLEAQSIVSGTMVVLVHSLKIIPITV